MLHTGYNNLYSISDECKVKPQALNPGQTVFFVIQPRFMNVDIRIIIDVTQGELDFFMSPLDDSFVVLANTTTGMHDIFLDSNYLWKTRNITPLNDLNIKPGNFLNETQHFSTPSIAQICKGEENSKKIYVRDEMADVLSKFIVINQCNTLLRVFGLRNRLVLTLPQAFHNLSITKFYIALRANSNSTASYGLIFFRQDQLHIDLFVFFSVFFSCFFLFLSICVMVWKAKQISDRRRARQRHIVEMMDMAKRPHAQIILDLDHHSSEKKSKKKVKNAQQTTSPIVLEPTSDGLAAVGTVFVRLPAIHKTPVSLALGSTLIVTNKNLTSRNYSR